MSLVRTCPNQFALWKKDVKESEKPHHVLGQPRNVAGRYRWRREVLKPIASLKFFHKVLHIVQPQQKRHNATLPSLLPDVPVFLSAEHLPASS